MSYTEIQNAFLDGMNEVYSIMFTNRVMLHCMDTANTKENVYGETRDKYYLDPIPLVGRVQTSFTKGEDPIESIIVSAIIDIPTKQLITNDIPYETWEDLELLRKAVMSYDNEFYLVTEVVPKTLVADKWQVYSFKCKKDKERSIGKAYYESK